MRKQSRGRRQERVSDQIRAEIADVLERHIQDPRLSGVVVTAVETSPDLQQATVFVSSLAGRAGSGEILAGLEHARGYLRRELGERLRLRVTPALLFRWDASMETGDHISRLLDSLGPFSQTEDEPAS